MASPRESTKRFNSPKGSQKAVLGRTSVYELFRQHAPVLAGLPGEVSQFNETGFGYEWRCEYQLDAQTSAGESPRDLRLQLHFSLMDLKNRRKPAAVLYLVEQDIDGDIRERHLLPLEDLGDVGDLPGRHPSDHAVLAGGDHDRAAVRAELPWRRSARRS